MKITKVFWKNAYLFLTLEAAEARSIYLLRSDGRERFAFRTEISAEGEYTARLNIATLEGSRTIPAGVYLIADDSDAAVPCEPSAIRDILSLSRVFRYARGANALNCTFECGFDDHTGIRLSFRAEYMRRNPRPQKRVPWEEAAGFSAKLKHSFLFFSGKMLNLLYHAARCFSAGKSRNVLFFSQTRDALSANPRAILTRMQERGLDKKYSCRIFCSNTQDGAARMKAWLKGVFALAKCNYVFLDDYTPLLNHLTLPKSVVVVQTWHAGFGFKLVGYSRFGYEGSPHPYHSSHRKYTYGLIGCESLKEIFSEAWGVDEEKLIATGLPRLDHFLDDDEKTAARARLYAAHPELNGKTYFVFAPTYRGMQQSEAYYDFDKIDFAALHEYCEESDTYCVFKMHHFILEDVPVPEEYRDRLLQIKDVDLNDLYYDASLLITDYSSCFYDFALLKKPVLFYVYDLEYYCATRGVQRAPEEVAPGKLCRSFSELIRALSEEDYEIEKMEHFFIDRCAERGKTASDIAIDHIFAEN